MLYAAIHWSGVQISLPRSFFPPGSVPALYRGGGGQAGIFGLVGYDARFTRERSRVRFSEDVTRFFVFAPDTTHTHS